MPHPLDHLPPYLRDIVEAFLGTGTDVGDVWLRLDDEARRKRFDGIVAALVAKGLCDQSAARAWVAAKVGSERFQECCGGRNEAECYDRLERYVREGAYDNEFKRAAVEPPKEQA